jgi:hypothetical protein
MVEGHKPHTSLDQVSRGRLEKGLQPSLIYRAFYSLSGFESSSFNQPHCEHCSSTETSLANVRIPWLESAPTPGVSTELLPSGQRRDSSLVR